VKQGCIGQQYVQFPAWLCLPLFVLTYLLSHALKLNDDDDDKHYKPQSC